MGNDVKAAAPKAARVTPAQAYGEPVVLQAELLREVPIATLAQLTTLSPARQALLGEVDRVVQGGGRTSARKIDAAFRAPGSRLVSSVVLADAEDAVQRTGVQLRGLSRPTTPAVPVDPVPLALLEGRSKDIGTWADEASTAPDNATTPDEVRALGQRLARGERVMVHGAPLVYETNQRLSTLKHLVARATGEGSPISAQANKVPTIGLLFPAYYVQFNPDHGIANVAATTYYSEDVRYAEPVERDDDRFYEDLALRRLGVGVDPKIFLGSFSLKGHVFDAPVWVFHRGHFIAMQDFVRQDDQQIGSMSNAMVHPQTPHSNSVVWLQYVEKMLRKSANDRGSRMALQAGPLFLDKRLRRLAPAAERYIGRDGKTGAAKDFAPGEDKAAIPTYTWKAVIEQSKEGAYSARVYVVANRMDLDTKAVPKRGVQGWKQELLTRGSAILSLAELEKLIGLRPVSDLPVEIRRAVGKDPGRRYTPKRPFTFLSAGQGAARRGG